MTLFEATVLLLMLLFCVSNLKPHAWAVPPRWFGPLALILSSLAYFLLFFTILQGVCR